MAAVIAALMRATDRILYAKEEDRPYRSRDQMLH